MDNDTLLKDIPPEQWNDILHLKPGDEGYYSTDRSAKRTLRARNKMIISERRAKVAKLVHGRVPQFEIARELKVAESTISEDIAWLKEQWRKEAMTDVSAEIERELTELAVWEARLADWAVQKRNPKYVDRILKIKEQRAKLLGLYRPAKVALTTPDGTQAYQGLSDDELDAKIATLMRQAGIDPPDE